MSESLRSALRQSEEQRLQLEQENASLRTTADARGDQAEQFRITLASIGDAVITTDIDARVTNLNAVAEALTGWATGDALGHRLDDVFRIVNETTRQTVESPVRRALEHGVIVGLANHTVLIAKDGTERPIDDSAAPIRRANGEVIGCVLVFRDIGERHRQEAELQARERQFHTLAESIPQLAWMANTDGHIFWYNRRWYEYTGTTLEQMEGWGWQRVHDPAALPAVMERWTAAIAAGTPFDMTFPLKGRDGQFRPFLTRVEPVTDDDGRVVRWFGTNTDIAAQQHTEDELRRNEQFNRSLMDGTADCVKVLDLDGRLLHMNAPGICAMEIDDVGPLCGQAWGALWPAASLSDIEGSVTRAVNGEVSSFEAFCPTAKGTPKWWEVTVSPVRDTAGGRVVRLLAMSRDITDRKAAEADRIRLLQQAEGEQARLAEVFRHAPAFLCVFRGPDHVFELVNDRYDQLVGHRDVLGRTVRDALPEVVAQGFVALLDNVYATGETLIGTGVPVFLARQAGQPQEERFLDMAYQALRDPGDAVTGILIVGVDVTERHRAETAVRSSEARYRTLFESMDEGYCVIEMIFNDRGAAVDYRFLETNPAFELHTGMVGAVGRTMRDFVPDLEANWFERYGRVVQTGEPVRFVDVAEAMERRWFDVFAYRLGAPGSSILAVVFSDITSRKRDEEALRRLTAELSEADRRKDEFLATLAHELRNPLAPIRNGLEVLKLAGGQVTAVEQTRLMMERQLMQMVRLVDDLLDVSRISRGQVDLRTERVALATVVHSAVEASRPLIEQMDHQLSVTIPPEPIMVDADMTRLAQVFVNLLNNAAKYSEQGGHIQLDVERHGAGVAVRVKDTGIGIAALQLPRIFDMFTQVDQSLERSQGGLGIGLTLVKRLVELHGGSVEAHSDGPGTGSEFVVRLPVVVDVSTTHVVKDEEVKQATSALRILIVDDNRDGADSLAVILRIKGNDVRTVYDGQTGVDEAAEFRPDVIVFDIGLPKLNGYEACRRIRAQSWGSSTMLIAVTGWGQDEDRRRSRDAGFDHHLVKPVDVQSLLKVLAGVHAATP